MSEQRVQTPVAFFIFNRPETTERVFGEIARARPEMLLVVADGPRADHAGEAERCRAARSIIERVDWDCEVLTDFSDHNLGCKRRISSGLDWVFATVEEAIILEDDCLPHPSFFRFCSELLERYRNDTRIAMISGNDFQVPTRRDPPSYYFSRYTHVWGWASWRRAWQHYDGELRWWEKSRADALLAAVVPEVQARKRWTRIFSAVAGGEIDSWAYPWMYSCWMQNMLSILPRVNLVSNVGFSTDATHTVGDSWLSNLPTEPMRFPLSHPPFVQRNVAADAATERTVFAAPPIAQRIRSWLVRMIQRLPGRVGSD
jgi:hypothetical protein